MFPAVSVSFSFSVLFSPAFLRFSYTFLILFFALKSREKEKKRKRKGKEKRRKAGEKPEKRKAPPLLLSALPLLKLVGCWRLSPLLLLRLFSGFYVLLGFFSRVHLFTSLHHCHEKRVAPALIQSSAAADSAALYLSRRCWRCLVSLMVSDT